MTPVIRHLLLAAAIVTALVACGSSGPRAGYPTISFVGNATCPTSGESPYEPMPPNVNSLPPVGIAVNEMPHIHVAEGSIVDYNHNPPTSGCHYNLGYGRAPIQSGVYNQVIQPEYWVHNLEHGYIVVLYSCPSGCTAQFNQLRTWYHSLPAEPNFAYPKVIVIPWPSMSVPFAAVSWDWYLPIPVFSISEVNRFYLNHRGQANEAAGP